ncbi:MAG TPA: MFS transporter [Dehalococcoidales bacterium]|nr:MFS transporter [Dehalococcoidales bacterium]
MDINNDLKKSSAIKPAGLSYAWTIVMLGTILSIVIYTYNNTFGVFYKPFADYFGWSRAAIALAFTIRSLVCAVLVVPMGYWADRYGIRKIILPSFILLGLCMMAVAKVGSLWQLYLVQGVGIGICMSGPVTCIIATVAKWHDKRRGMAIGITSAGFGLSSVIFPPLATFLIQAVNWKFATFILGVIILVIGIPCSLLFKEPLDSVKQTPTSGKGSPAGIFDAWKPLAYYLKSPVFLSIIIMFMLISAFGNMLSSHFINYATDIGISAIVAAGMMSTMGIAGTIGRLGMGVISDRIGNKSYAAICWLLMALSFALFITKQTALLWVAAVPFGIGYGGTIPLPPAIMGERMDTNQLNTATGVGIVGGLIGAAVGPWLGGLIFDVTGHYLWALILGILGCLTGLFIALRIPPPRRNIS